MSTREFRRDPYFLPKYYLWNFVIYALGCVVLLACWTPLHEIPYGWMLFISAIPLALPSFWMIVASAAILVFSAFFFGLFEIFPADLLLIPLGAYIGLLSAFLMHNATHVSIRPKWINRIVGELCGLQQLMGFSGWAIAHILHHQFPDDPEKDPHPPENLSFPEFMGQMGASMARVMDRNFLNNWGEVPRFRRAWRGIQIFSPIIRYLRAVFLLLLFGPKVFTLCFIPSKLLNVVIYAHFNYFTHRLDSNGEVTILNLDEGVFYKILNFLTFGSYYHKNHHMKPSLFDPRNLDCDEDERLVSYVYSSEAEVALEGEYPPETVSPRQVDQREYDESSNQHS